MRSPDGIGYNGENDPDNSDVLPARESKMSEYPNVKVPLSPDRVGEKASEWRPIESAPKDKCILLFGESFYKGHRVPREDAVKWDGEPGVWMGIWTQAGYRVSYGAGGAWVSNENGWLINPTHWMPLPSPPDV